MDMGSNDQDSDLIQYVRAHADKITQSSAYFVDIVELAEQIQDTPENRLKLADQLRKNLPLLKAHAEAWQGLLTRITSVPRSKDRQD